MKVTNEQMSALPKIVAIDFDGTLVTNAFPHIGEPIKDTIDLCHKLRAHGVKLILWTCRNGANLEEALVVCEELGLVFDAVNDNIPEVIELFGASTRKVHADVYIDDKATDFGVRPHYWWNNLGLDLVIEGGTWHLNPQ